jgi:DNA-3-methyladenine glycosylase II
MRNSFEILLEDIECQYLMQKDERLCWLLSTMGSIECSKHSDPFRFLVDEIIEQMLSVRVADIIRDRFYLLCEGDVSPDKILQLSIEQIRSVGISTQKASYILGLCAAIHDNRLLLPSLGCLSDEQVISELKKQKDIGTWTAKMFLIFVLQRDDFIPFEDTAFVRGMKGLYQNDDLSREEIIAICKEWSPYASIAARYIYRAVDMGII